MKRNRTYRTIIVFAMIIALCMALASCSKSDPGSDIVPINEIGSSKAPEDAQEDNDSGSNIATGVVEGEKSMVEITMENGGVITLELDHEAAPITVENFLKLVNENFYDGLTFHRIIPGFMIQGGDPDGTGMGGSSDTIKGEFTDNGWDNPIGHERGVISMARSNMPNSASSQFFITNADVHFLDGQYAAFGKVVSGMEVVDEISAVQTGANDYPTSPVVISTIRETK